MTDYLQVVTTTDSEAAAAALARSAVEARLAACAQVIGPITSYFHWDGQAQTEREWQVVLKTTTDRYDELERRLTAEHGYDEPEIVATPIVAGSAGYLAWVGRETAP